MRPSPRWVCRCRSKPAPATLRRRKRQRQRRAPARHPADHAGATGLAAGLARRAPFCSPTCAVSCSTNCTRWHLQARRSAGAGSRAAAQDRAGPRRHRPVGDGGRSRRAAPLDCRRRTARLAALVDGAAGRQPGHARCCRPTRAPALGRPFRPPRHGRNLRRRSKQARMTLVFVNTRAQAEFAFQELWRINDDNLPIALHHGSLAAEPAPQGRGGDGARARSRRWSAPRPSISASTGARSTW